MPAPAADQPAAGQPSAADRRPRLKILMVEDHADSSRAMAKLLALQGHDVRTVAGVRDALAAASGEEFDLLVSDIGLPDGSGLDLMRDLCNRSAGRPPKGIAITGRTAPEDAQRSREAGFAAHLVKPVDFDKLERLIRELTA